MAHAIAKIPRTCGSAGRHGRRATPRPDGLRPGERSSEAALLTEAKKLLASDAQAGDSFGYSVAISGNIAVVGARQKEAGGSDAGAAYVFDLLLSEPTSTNTPSPTVTPTKLPLPGDTDGDGCPDADENEPDELLGGHRDYMNPWDYFNPTNDGQNRVDDILNIVKPTPTVTSTPTITPTPGLPDLTVASMKVTFENGGDCDWVGASLGIRIFISNVGTGDTGSFVVDVNGAQQTVASGLAASDSLPLWFTGYHYMGKEAAFVDATDQVQESNELNNQVSQVLPVPTPPVTCTPASAPTLTPVP